MLRKVGALDGVHARSKSYVQCRWENTDTDSKAVGRAYLILRAINSNIVSSSFSSPRQIPVMVFKNSVALALLSSLLSSTLAADVFVDLPILNANVAPDGFTRSAIVAGAFPGKLITANKGDVLHINVTNQLTDPTMRRSTSIVSADCTLVFAGSNNALQHWHGIFQPKTAS